ncbi:hypothetical protein BU26DRAFT_557346 [Trematosphaeria pertusa]|uniref:Uncharacterized protein n=1 Tax=Trematosphaeria pertusa TaxID=390896 RepID=A0A6A6IZH2_9PLEO|nr:uncharacterized protein BU26DRAFT_557346 [Trematosphaeria pertusa]KAF2255844.1 hypothetical protein BU26DRAFT_557346 [Trematosphaeria pertusa]
MGGLQQQAPLVKFGKYTGNIKPEKVADMGFLFRSYTTDAAIAEKPEIVDAVNLTGIPLSAGEFLALAGSTSISAEEWDKASLRVTGERTISSATATA